MSSATIDATWLLPNATDAAIRSQTLTIAGGRIAAIETSTGRGGKLVLPVLANAHDHARFVRLSQVGSFDIPLAVC